VRVPELNGLVAKARVSGKAKLKSAEHRDGYPASLPGRRRVWPCPARYAAFGYRRACAGVTRVGDAGRSNRTNVSAHTMRSVL